MAIDDQLLPGGTKMSYNMRGAFAWTTGVISVVLLICYFALTEYAVDPDVDAMYSWYIHVAIMIFVGFGFLMTFLRRYSLGAVSLNFLASCIVMLEAILVVGAFRAGGLKDKIEVNLELVTQSAFAAGASMITFGAVLGKVSPAQLVLLVVLEVPFYAVNAITLIEDNFAKEKGVQDVGGSMAIHAFGAYFGLAATLVLSKRVSGEGHPKNGSAYINDVTSMIGTIFLWIFWPSFNAAVAEGDGKYYAIINTVVSLLGACMVTFFCSAVYEGKLNMVHIQNATLAGGVAVGSAAGMDNLGPGGALCIGLVGGWVSTTGFAYFSSCLESRVGLKDTCGVHNLHGLPGILGGVAAACALAVKGSHDAAGYQLLALLVTLAIAVTSGLLCGFLVSFVDKVEPLDAVAYEDASAFSCEVDELPEEAPVGASV